MFDNSNDIIDLMAKGKLPEAAIRTVALVYRTKNRTFLKESVIISMDIHNQERMHLKGTIDDNELSIKRNKCAERLLDLIAEIEDHIKENGLDSSSKSYKDS